MHGRDSLSSFPGAGKKGQAALSIVVALGVWFPQVIHVTFPAQLPTCFLFSFLPHPMSFLWQLRHMSLEGFSLYSVLFFLKLICSPITFFFFNWKTFSLLSHNSRTAEQIFCRLSRPIYLGDETEQTKFKRFGVSRIEREVWPHFTAITWARNPGVLI